MVELNNEIQNAENCSDIGKEYKMRVVVFMLLAKLTKTVSRGHIDSDVERQTSLLYVVHLIVMLHVLWRSLVLVELGGHVTVEGLGEHGVELVAHLTRLHLGSPHSEGLLPVFVSERVGIDGGLGEVEGVLLLTELLDKGVVSVFGVDTGIFLGGPGGKESLLVLLGVGSGGEGGGNDSGEGEEFHCELEGSFVINYKNCNWLAFYTSIDQNFLRAVEIQF